MLNLYLVYGESTIGPLRQYALPVRAPNPKRAYEHVMEIWGKVEIKPYSMYRLNPFAPEGSLFSLETGMISIPESEWLC